MMSKPLGVLFGVLTLVAILAIAPSAFAQESSATVNISAGAGSGPTCSQSNNCFDPDTITVAPGTTVEWKNNDKVSHTVTSGSPSDNQTGTIFDSSLIAAGKDFSFTFNNPGTYNYFCQVHPWMTGQVIVSASATSAPAASTSSTTNMSSSSMAGMSSSSSMNTTTPSNTPTSTTPAVPATPAPSTAPVDQSQQASQMQQQVQQGGSQIAQQASQGQQSGIPLGTPTGTQYTLGSGGIQEPSTAGSDPMPAYAAGIAIIGIMSGIGIWSAVRRR